MTFRGLQRAETGEEQPVHQGKYMHGKIKVIGKYGDYSYRNGERMLLVSELRTTFFLKLKHVGIEKRDLKSSEGWRLMT